MSERSIQHVSDTAFLVAQCRAWESEQPDALFRDPLAARLAGDKGRAILASWPTQAMTRWMVAIRTVVIDAFIRAAIARGVDVVVNLGAGLDTRPYRLDLPPELRWVEVDYPDVIAFKEQQLEQEVSHCRLERVALDLAQVAERRELLARLDASATRLLVLTEGVVPYLANQAVASLAADLRALSHVDGWIVDYISPESHAYRKRAGLTEKLRHAPFQFQPGDWFAFFAAHGWGSREVRYLASEGERRRRPVPLPWRVKLIMRLLRLFASAEKRGRFQRFSGYVLLEPTAEAPTVT